MVSKDMTLEEAQALVQELQIKENNEKYDSIESIKSTLLGLIEKKPDFDGVEATVKDSTDNIRKEAYIIAGGLQTITNLVNSFLEGSEYRAVKPFSSSRQINLVRV
jgi:hypothetical protein